MKEQNIAKVYAQSFIELGNENKVDMANELTRLTEVINVSNDLENVLFLDVFTNEEKLSVFDAIAEKISLPVIVKEIVHYLVNEKRMNLLPLIIKEVIVIDDHNKGFLKGIIEGSQDTISDAEMAKLKKAIKERIGKEPTLTYTQSSSVTAGFRVTVDDLQLDASLDNQLQSFKQSILGE